MEMNQQIPEHRVRTDQGTYDVQEIWKTIQGEGPFVGCPAVFVRLAGCNLQCPLCDTDYTSKRHHMSSVSIGLKVEELREHALSLVVITGGEPFRQPLKPLVRDLLTRGYTVQIETNGTLYQEDFPFYNEVTIVCSPKSTFINKSLQPHISALKYVVQAGHVDEADGLPTMVLGMPVRVARWWPTLGAENIYVQPADEQDEVKNAANQKAALDSCMKYGYRFCLQTHKILGLP